jgi:hypothetical protein
MPRRGASHYRVRSIGLATVVSGHVTLLALLAIHHAREPDTSADKRMTLVFVDPLEETGLPIPRQTATRPARASATPAEPTQPSTSAPDESTAITPQIDWYANGSRAAQRAATEPATREFGFPKRATAAREKKAFGWDKTHTERVTALPEGGMLIRLSDNCAIVLAPLPFGGCTIGKRQARGDLFDEMKAPVEPGDWH